MSGRICAGCRGVLGRDCWNEADCVWITADMTRRAAETQRPPEPCQGCSMVTGGYIGCLGLCVGATCQEDIDARAALWSAIPTTFAAALPPDHAYDTAAEMKAANESLLRGGGVLP